MNTPYARVVIRVENMIPQPPDDKGWRPSDRSEQVAEVSCCAGDVSSALLQAQSHVAVLVDFHTPASVTR